MKKLLLFALTLLVGQICFASQSKTKTCDNNVSQVFKNVFIELPEFREIQGGSKIVVNYDNSVPMEMQGAFEYAVKLWEAVFLLFAVNPRNQVLHHPKRANHRAIHTAKNEREQHQRHYHHHIQSQHGWQKLHFRQPSHLCATPVKSSSNSVINT